MAGKHRDDASPDREGKAAREPMVPRPPASSVLAASLGVVLLVGIDLSTSPLPR